MVTRITSILAIASFFLISACSSSNPARAYEIGLLNLPGYAPVSRPGPPASEHMVITTESAFTPRFTAAASDTSSLRKPEFSGQMVVAVVYRQDTVTQVLLDRATISGNTLNIYYHLATSSYATSAGAVTLATVPKSGNVKQARFFRNEKEVATAELTR